MFAHWMAKHCVEHPVRRRRPHQTRGRIQGSRRACGTTRHEVCSDATLKPPGQMVRTPDIKSILWNVSQRVSNRSRIKTRANNPTIEIRVARENLPSACKPAFHTHLGSGNFLGTG